MIVLEAICFQFCLDAEVCKWHLNYIDFISKLISPCLLNINSSSNVQEKTETNMSSYLLIQLAEHMKQGYKRIV